MSFEACAAASGTGFLKSSLFYLDCAGREIGATGYTSLIQPGSPIQQLILVGVTFVIAWQGIRMMFGRTVDMGDAVMIAAKIGLVLMLATSWPAVRTLFSEPATSGSRELVVQSGPSGPQPLEVRLQRVDDGIVTLTKWGTGKLDIRAGRTADGQIAATEFTGIALTDSLALGLGRLSFLVGALMSLGLVKLLSGIMVAALPLFAGLILFEASRGLFWGWLKLMFALLVAGFAIPVILTVELALIEPWLTRAIGQRSASLAAPSAPTELLAISTSFLLILSASMALIAKACLSSNHLSIAGRLSAAGARLIKADAPILRPEPAYAAASQRTELSRAANLATSIGRLDQMSRGGTLHASHAGRSAGQSYLPHEPRQAAAPMGRHRARQRMALSHLRRNQK